MNPFTAAQPSPLYGHFMHAGGWPKLGWEPAEGEHDEAPGAGVDDEVEAAGLYA